MRLRPALARAGSGRAALVKASAGPPMRLGEAVTTWEALLDQFDAAGVPGIRVGLQVGPDVPDALVAGPAHPHLRGLVEARRYRPRMAAALRDHPRARPAVLRVTPRDLSCAKGTANANLKALRATLGLRMLSVEPDPVVERGDVALKYPWPSQERMPTFVNFAGDSHNF